MSAVRPSADSNAGSAEPNVAFFLHLVRARGLVHVGTGDYIRVERLLSSRPRWREDELANALAALLATSEETWRQLHTLASESLGLGGTAVAGWQGSGAGAAPAVPAGAAAGAAARRQRHPWRQLLPVVLVVLTALSIGLAGPLLYRDDPPLVTHVTPAPPPAPPVEASGWRLEEIDPARSLGESVRTTLRQIGWRDALAFACGLFLMALALRWWLLPPASRAQRQQSLEKVLGEGIAARQQQRSKSYEEREDQVRELVESGESLLVPFQVPELPAVRLSVIDDAAVTLGRIQEELPGQEQLAEDATVKATVEAGGRIVPVFEQGRAQATLLVLVDDEKSGHPYLQGFHRVLDRWQQRGVRMLRFSFREQPDPLWPYPRGAPLSFDELSRRHPELPLIVFSRRLTHTGLAAGGAPWTKRLEVWPVKAWIDPDPTPLAEPSRRPGFRHDVAGLKRLGFARFGLDEADLLMLARYLAEGGAGIAPPRRRPLPRWTQEIEDALGVWAVAAARVPQADWDMVEYLRRAFVDVKRRLPERRHVALLIRWVNQRQGTPSRRHQGFLEIEDAEIERLRREQAEADRVLPASERLLTRIAKMLLEQLQASKPAEDLRFLRLSWELKRAELEAVGDPEALQTLAAFRGTAVDALAEREARMVLAEGSLAPEQKEHLAREWFPAEARHEACPGVEVAELLRGHGKLWWLSVSAGAALVGIGAGVWAVGQGLSIPPPIDGLRQALLARQQVVRGDSMPKISRLIEGGKRPAMIPVLKGSFMMGSPSSEPDRYRDETQHEVAITQSFNLAETEITQAQYEAVMGSNPSSNTACGGDCPVESVSWFDAVTYANQLSVAEGLEPCYQISGEEVSWPKRLGCKGYRLPTEAEWEYAARAGTGDRFAGTDDPEQVCLYGNVADAAAKEAGARTFGGYFECNDAFPRLAPTSRFEPNRLGLHDMTGNVYEWVWDWFDDYEPDAFDSVGPPSGRSRVIRGGSFVVSPRFARVAYRFRNGPSLRFSTLGFRVARSLP